MVDYEHKGNFIRFNCSECGKIVFGIEALGDFTYVDDIYDSKTTIMCPECNQR